MILIRFRRTKNNSEQQQHPIDNNMKVTYSEEEEQEILRTDETKPEDERRDDKSCGETTTASCNRTTNKSVAFNPHVGVRLIEKHQELSPEIRAELWYTLEDFQKIQGYTRTTLCLLNSNTQIPPNYEDRFCFRGLEGRTRRALRFRARVRNTVWRAVLVEQEQQVAECLKDPMAIAEASSSVSSYAQEKARDAAIRDELDVRRLSAEEDALVSQSMTVSILNPIELCRWTIW